MPNKCTNSGRFYHEYLVSSANEKASNGVLSAQYEDAVYKKSLPSLLFLSFGIFLLNSVNEIMSRRGVIATARMLVRLLCGTALKVNATSTNFEERLLDPSCVIFN